MSRYLLVSMEDFETKEITIPDGLVVNTYKEFYENVTDKDLLKTLLLKLSKAGISQSEHGLVKHKDTILNGIVFKNAVLDSCNGDYKDCYEPFYALLRKFGIVF